MTNRKIWLTVSLFIFAFVVISCNGTSPTTTNQTTTANVTSPTPTPTPKPTPHPAAQSALKSLRRMASATEVGINFQEYGTRVIDLKADVDEELAQLPEGELKQEIKLAMEAYADASTAWNQMLKYDFMLSAYEPAKTLQKKYSIRGEKSSAGGGQMLNKNVVLSTIWGAARKHIERATQLNQ